MTGKYANEMTGLSMENKERKLTPGLSAGSSRTLWGECLLFNYALIASRVKWR